MPTPQWISRLVEAAEAAQRADVTTIIEVTPLGFKVRVSERSTGELRRYDQLVTFDCVDDATINPLMLAMKKAGQTLA